MARPKVAGWSDPPRHIKAQVFKDEQKWSELDKHKKYTKEARAKREIQIDLNVPPWARGFINVIHPFKAGHEIDRKIATYIAVEAKANKKDEE